MARSRTVLIGPGVMGAVLAAMLVATALGSSAGAQVATAMCGGQPATIIGTSGNDNLNGTSGPDVIAGLQGDDRITGLDGDDIICGGLGNDTIRGGDGFDIIFGAQGDDVIWGNFGESVALREDIAGNRIFGGAGDDIIHGTNRWDRMQGGPGNDILRGYEGRDWLRGGADRDDVSGGGGIDDLHGGNGSDRIAIAGADVVRGGAGVDTCILASEPEVMRSCGRNLPEPTRLDGTVRFSAGTYLTPREVAVGLYRTNRYWQLDDAEGRTIRNDFQFDNGPTVAFVDERSATIEFATAAQRVDSLTPRVNPFQFENGSFLVGLDVAPGTYRVRGIGDSSAYAQSYDVRGGTIDTELGAGSVVIVIGPEAAFLDFSGTLERI